MRILITNENRGAGGAEQYTAALVRGLRGRGHEVTLAVRPGSWLSQQGLDGQTLGFSSELDPVTLARLTALAGRAHVVHCQANRDLALCGLIPRPLRLFKSEHTFLEPTRSGLLNRAYRRCHVLAVSHALAQQIHGELPTAKVSVVPNGIDLQAYRELPEPLPRLREHRWIGCLAGMIPGKGQDDLIAAFTLLDDPDLRLVLAGDGPERPRLETLARPLGDRVWFPGHLEDPRTALAGLAVAVVPSYKETFSLACLEALAAGVPLVASRTGGIPEVVGQAALLVPPGEPEELARALGRALRETPPDGPLQAARFSQARMLDTLENLYR